MADVFISYSRKDAEFVRHLHDALAARGRDAWVDWEDIPLTAEWWSEIQRGIEAADTFVFVISPDSARSKVCFDEVEHAHQNNKRIVPILHREVTEEPDQERLHWTINRHNWAFFRAEDDFDAAFDGLIEALDTDLEYVKRHTNLLLRAKNWDAIGRVNSPLLRGADLRAAEEWLASVGDKEPKPTDLHAAYILASRKAANRFQRTVTISVSLALIIMAALTVLSFGLFRQSEDRRQESDQRGTVAAEQALIAQQNEANAITARNDAVAAQETSEANLYEARRVQSLFLADLSQQQLVAGAPQDALLLALESLQHYRAGEDDSVYTSAGSRALASAMSASGNELAYRRVMGGIRYASWNADGTQLLVPAGQTAIIWDVTNGAEQLVAQHAGSIVGATWNADETLILTWSSDGTARVSDAASGTERLILRHQSQVGGAVWNADETLILTWSSDGSVRIWDAVTGAERQNLRRPFHVYDATWNADGTRVLLWSWSWRELLVWDVAAPGEISTHPLALTDVSEVNGATWNADGTRILAWASYGRAWVWDALTGELVLKLEMGGNVGHGEWNADETLILTYSDKTTGTLGEPALQVWDATLPEEGIEATALVTLPYSASISGVRWNMDGTRILAWYTDGIVKQWQIELADSGAAAVEQLTLGHDDRVTGAMWDRYETQIVTWGEDGTVRFWNATTGAEQRQLNHGYPVRGAAWNPTRHQILTWAIDDAVRVWDTGRYYTYDLEQATGVRVMQCASPAGFHEFTDFGWYADDQRVIAVCARKGVVWNVPFSVSGMLMPRPHGGEVEGAVANADGTRIFAWSPAPATVWFWDIAPTDEPLRQPEYTPLAQFDMSIRWATWNAPGTRVIARLNDGTLRIYDAETDREFFRSESGTSASWSPAGTRLLLWSQREIRILDAATGTELFYTEPGATRVVWHPAGTHILTLSEDDTLCLWDTATGVELFTMTLDSAIEDVVWSVDGTRLLTWSRDDMRIWNTATGAELLTLSHADDIAHVAWSPDNTGLLTVSTKGVARIWDVVTDAEPLTLPLDYFVLGAVWHSDGARILVWLDDGTIRIWDTAIGAELLALSHADTVRQARWNADETQILAWTADEAIYVWPGSLTALIEHAESHITRDLTNEQHAQFFLPMLVPTSTPTPAPTLTPLPEITPLPTLTPSITPTPDATATP